MEENVRTLFSPFFKSEGLESHCKVRITLVYGFIYGKESRRTSVEWGRNSPLLLRN